MRTLIILLPKSGPIKNKFSLILLFLLTLPMLALPQADPLSLAYLPSMDTNAADYPSNIWITDTLQKVRQDAGSPGPQHWGTFYGTQNEFVDFQVHVKAPAGGYSALTITVSNFVESSPSSYTISNASPQIIVYREAYMAITDILTNTSSATYYGALGYYPDILIPTKDPYWGQTTSAFPVNVAANQNQSAWVDVLIPQNAPSGYYLGSITVQNGSTILATMPVIIGVWQWPSSLGGSMPSSTTLRTVVYNWSYNGLCTQMYTPGAATNVTSLCGSYPGAGGASITNNDMGNTLVWLDGDLLMKDHRFSDSGRENIYPQSGSFSSYDTQVGPIMNGGCVVHNGSGNTCPILTSSKNNSKQLGYTSISQSVWSNWQSNFNTKGWSSTLFDLLCDEPPNGCNWANLVSNGNARHSYLTPGVPELVTTDLVSATNNSAQNVIDWMAVNIVTLEPIGGPLQNLQNYQTWTSGSTDGVKRQFMSYQSCSSAGTCSNGIPGPGPSGYSYTTWPNYNIDGKPAANRAMEWMTYLHGQTGELYYATDICMTPQSQGSQCGLYTGHASPFDPWVSVYYSGGWGDGTLVYAGSTVSSAHNYMGPGVTIPIILPSVRLKQIRDGMQDYEYMNVLKNTGKSSQVQQAISTWITNSYTFETSGSGLQTARMALGSALHQLTYPLVLLPPPSLNGVVQ